MCRRTLSGMSGAVKGVGFSWDGSFVVGGSDEGNGLEIVSFFFLLSLLLSFFPFPLSIIPPPLPAYPIEAALGLDGEGGEGGDLSFPSV